MDALSWRATLVALLVAVLSSVSTLLLARYLYQGYTPCAAARPLALPTVVKWDGSERLVVVDKQVLVLRVLATRRCYIMPLKYAQDELEGGRLEVVPEVLSELLVTHFAGSQSAAFCARYHTYLLREPVHDEGCGDTPSSTAAAAAAASEDNAKRRISVEPDGAQDDDNDSGDSLRAKRSMKTDEREHRHHCLALVFTCRGSSDVGELWHCPFSSATPTNVHDVCEKQLRRRASSSSSSLQH